MFLQSVRVRPVEPTGAQSKSDRGQARDRRHALHQSLEYAEVHLSRHPSGPHACRGRRACCSGPGVARCERCLRFVPQRILRRFGPSDTGFSLGGYALVGLADRKTAAAQRGRQAAGRRS
jgi:hypothetical protein